MLKFLILLFTLQANAQPTFFNLYQNSLKEILCLNNLADLSTCKMTYEGWLLGIICPYQYDNK